MTTPEARTDRASEIMKLVRDWAEAIGKLPDDEESPEYQERFFAQYVVWRDLDRAIAGLAAECERMRAIALKFGELLDNAGWSDGVDDSYDVFVDRTPWDELVEMDEARLAYLATAPAAGAQE